MPPSTHVYKYSHLAKELRTHQTRKKNAPLTIWDYPTHKEKKNVELSPDWLGKDMLLKCLVLARQS